MEQIREPLHLQFFCSLSGYEDKRPFNPSDMVRFRKRLTPEIFGKINENNHRTEGIIKENGLSKPVETRKSAGESRDYDCECSVDLQRANTLGYGMILRQDLVQIKVRHSISQPTAVD